MMGKDRFRLVFSVLLAALAFFAFMAVFLSLEAHAQQQRICGPFPEMRQTLETRFHEVQIGGGVVNEQSIALLFASPDGATWTMLILDTRGIACVVAGGAGWDWRELPSTDKGA